MPNDLIGPGRGSRAWEEGTEGPHLTATGSHALIKHHRAVCRHLVALDVCHPAPSGLSACERATSLGAPLVIDNSLAYVLNIQV